MAALGSVKVFDNATDLGLHGDPLLGVGFPRRLQGHDQVSNSRFGDLDGKRGGFDLLVGGGGGAFAGGLGRSVFRLIFRFGGGLVEDEKICAGGGQNEDQKTTQDGFGNAHRPPPNLC